MGRYVEIDKRVILRDITVWNFPYFECNSEVIYSDIGHFCSIASQCMCECAREHPMACFSTYKIHIVLTNILVSYMALDSSLL